MTDGSQEAFSAQEVHDHGVASPRETEIDSAARHAELEAATVRAKREKAEARAKKERAQARAEAAREKHNSLVRGISVALRCAVD